MISTTVSVRHVGSMDCEGGQFGADIHDVTVYGLHYFARYTRQDQRRNQVNCTTIMLLSSLIK